MALFLLVPKPIKLALERADDELRRLLNGGAQAYVDGTTQVLSSDALWTRIGDACQKAFGQRDFDESPLAISSNTGWRSVLGTTMDLYRLLLPLRCTSARKQDGQIHVYPNEFADPHEVELCQDICWIRLLFVSVGARRTAMDCIGGLLSEWVTLCDEGNRPSMDARLMPPSRGNDITLCVSDRMLAQADVNSLLVFLIMALSAHSPIEQIDIGKQNC